MRWLRLYFGTSVTAICLAWYADDFAARLRAADELWAAGDKAAAEKLLLDALRVTERFAKDDTPRATVLTKLGSAYLSQGRYTAAEACYRRAISIWEERPDRNEELVRAVGNLAVLYLETGQYARADRLQLRPLLARASKSNLQDADISWLLATMGVLDYRRGRYAEAERNQNAALAIAEKLATSGPEITQILNNLGAVQLRTLRYAAALSSYQRALRIAESGGLPPIARARSMALLLANLGTTHLITSGPWHAEPFYVRALALAEDNLGATDPLVGRILSCYAVVLRHTIRDAKAKEVERRAKIILQARSGNEFSHLVVDVNDILRRP